MGVWPLLQVALPIVAVVGYYRDSVGPILGKENWSLAGLLVWAAAVWILSAQSLGWVFGQFEKYSGMKWFEDRQLFASAGGYAIGWGIPVLAFCALFGVFSLTWYQFDEDPIGFVRHPWLFLVISKVYGDIIVFIVARSVFRARFARFRR